MEEFKITLENIERLKRFVKACEGIKGEVLVPQDNFVINAKSILGMLSLDLSRELTVKVKSEYLDELFTKIEGI